MLLLRFSAPQKHVKANRSSPKQQPPVSFVVLLYEGPMSPMRPARPPKTFTAVSHQNRMKDLHQPATAPLSSSAASCSGPVPQLFCYGVLVCPKQHYVFIALRHSLPGCAPCFCQGRLPGLLHGPAPHQEVPVVRIPARVARQLSGLPQLSALCSGSSDHCP